MAWVTWRQHRTASDRSGRAVCRNRGVACGSSAFSCTTPTPPRSPATRRAHCLQQTGQHLQWHVRFSRERLHLASSARPRSGHSSVRRCWLVSWRPVLSATPGPRASGGGAGHLPSWWPRASVTAAAGAISVLALLVLPAVLSRRQPGLVRLQGVADHGVSRSRPACSTCAGVTFAAWTLAAFAIGVLAGVLIRRVVPAIVATLVVYTGLAFAVGGIPAPALLGAARHHQAEHARFRMGHQPAVAHQGAAGR